MGRAQLLIAILAVAPIAIGGGIWASRSLPGDRTGERDMVLILAGDFLIGSNRVDTEGKSSEFGVAKPLYLDEHPQQTITLPAYWIDRAGGGPTEATRPVARPTPAAGSPRPARAGWSAGLSRTRP